MSAPLQHTDGAAFASVRDRAEAIRSSIPEGGLFADKQWRISPDPFSIATSLHGELESLGAVLRQFLSACNRLYQESRSGGLPPWISEWLDRGKPRSLVRHASDPRFRSSLPRVLRPDILLTEDGWKITEIDSVPGGIGLTGWLQAAYGRDMKMVSGFHDALCPNGEAVAVIVSRESAGYLPEMQWLAREIRRFRPHAAFDVFAPEQIDVDEDAVLVDGRRVDVIYRFFELFDLPNIPKADELLQAELEGRVTITPPIKPLQEEKMLLALFWEEHLRPFWTGALGEKTVAYLRQHFPESWVVTPPTGGRPRGLDIGGWEELKNFSQKRRRLVLKLSGFSEQAWGGRSVRIGHDLSSPEWSKAIDHAIQSFESSPYVLQRFEKGRQVETSYFDFGRDELIPMRGRVRLCPYYFIRDEEEQLSGILATICPPDKKIIHGMRDAVMTLAVPRSG